MNASASYIWLAYAFGIGVAMALVDRALKVRWLAGLFAIGGAAFVAYIGYASYVRGHQQGLLLVLILAGLITAGYVLTEVLVWIGGRVSK